MKSAGWAIDIAIVAAVWHLTAIGLLNPMAFLAIVGPMAGARVTALRKGDPGGGSAALALLLGVWALLSDWKGST